MNSFKLVARLWLHTWLLLNIGMALFILLWQPIAFMVIFLFALGSLFGGLPALVIYLLVYPRINKLISSHAQKIQLLFLVTAGIALVYSAVITLTVTLAMLDNPFHAFPIAMAALCGAGLPSITINRNKLFIQSSSINAYSLNLTNSTHMENFPASPDANTQPAGNGNKPLFKGLITAGLILLLLIPTSFISNLVTERQFRQQEVVKEVTGKWAGEQRITFPYLYIPYYHKDSTNHTKPATKFLVILPDNLDVNGEILPEQRLRSIYKVLLYKSTIVGKGNFAFDLPKDVDPSALVLPEAKICMGISDFKGIEKRIDVRIRDKVYTLSPGLPTNAVDQEGLSATIDLTKEDLAGALPFSVPLSLKGSEQLHFVPLGGNSQFTLRSPWPDPSFDGNTIPSERKVSEAGFTAKWVFNKANLPFGPVRNNEGIKIEPFAFGVTMVQPADQYAKTSRSVKYAILFIGLTFSLFFIIELLQKKPVHPVQYVLVGLALIIFYSLLLAISEFVLFDLAYLIASLATISLITLYAKAHFRKWGTASIFGGSLTVLYTFIFVLIRLEDTALLVGSIGLFIMLAAAMYASRKINWYHLPVTEPATA